MISYRMAEIAHIPRYTVADFLQWEGDWELWDGIAVSMAPSPTFDHQDAAGGLLSSLRRQLSDDPRCVDCTAVSEVDWHVSETTIVRPDVSVVCQRPKGKWIDSPPALLAEILSPSTREKDLTAKKELYATRGVRFYVIGDPETKELTILELGDASYSERSGEGLEIHEGCTLSIDAAEVFG